MKKWQRNTRRFDGTKHPISTGIIQNYWGIEAPNFAGIVEIDICRFGIQKNLDGRQTSIVDNHLLI